MIRLPFFKPRVDLVAALHGDIMAASRWVDAYRDHGVSDDFEGRFERLVLIATLVLRRLKALPGSERATQELVDRIFTGLDDGIRLIGISDIAVGKKVKKLARSFYGRAEGYTTALEAGEGALRAALARNLLGGRIAPEAVAPALIAEIDGLNRQLAGADLAALLDGRVLKAHYDGTGKIESI